VALCAVLLPLSALVLLAQAPPGPVVTAPPNTSSDSPLPDQDDRILGVLPNFLTVSDPQQAVEPLTPRQKFALVARQTYDPVTILSAAAGAGLSQAPDDDPKYGRGGIAYAQRFGAAITDLSTQNFFGGAVLASLLHEDPRYFREGPQYGFWNRIGYALSRVVVTRTDAGGDRFAYSNIIGMAMGIALSNAYYPDASVSGREVAQRFGTSLLSSAVFNILPEFWPDIHQKFFHNKGSNAKVAQTKQPRN
jgi:hypothetical protein